MAPDFRETPTVPGIGEGHQGKAMSNDVLAEELPLACLPFDRPALVTTADRRVGLDLFNASYGYGGLSLAAWEMLRERALSFAPDNDVDWDDATEQLGLRKLPR